MILKRSHLPSPTNLPKKWRVFNFISELSTLLNPKVKMNPTKALKTILMVLKNLRCLMRTLKRRSKPKVSPPILSICLTSKLGNLQFSTSIIMFKVQKKKLFAKFSLMSRYSIRPLIGLNIRRLSWNFIRVESWRDSRRLSLLAMEAQDNLKSIKLRIGWVAGLLVCFWSVNLFFLLIRTTQQWQCFDWMEYVLRQFRT